MTARVIRSALGTGLLSAALGGCATGGSQPAPASTSANAVSPDVESASVRPGINDAYLDASAEDMDDWTERLEGESREVVQSRDAIVAAMGLSPGASVADIGAGTGLFALALSDAVGADGTVYAVDIAPQFLAHVEARMREASRDNFVFHLAQPEALGLAEDVLDVAFMCNVYHHVEYPDAYLPTIARALKPGGILWLVDFKRVEGVTDPGILAHVRANQAQVVSEVTAAGFELVEAPALLDKNYVLKFVWRGPTDGE